ncbi:MAG: endonuclease/exonuclease/phosphatase family protein [Desulfobacteraceae bacterium]|nr:endonuclease/exonuclease/phosphatase family protein [Desulfobacteraceae bacterium]
MTILLKCALSVILVTGLALSALIVYGTITNYRPEEKTVISETGNPDTIPAGGGEELSMLIWNIGYGGLSADMDFFYDGGAMVRTTRENVRTNLEQIRNYLQQNKDNDFLLLQEVDRGSGRSYYHDEFLAFSELLNSHKARFAVNYDVKFVPVPFTSPLGKVLSGLGTFSRFEPRSSVRFSFPGNYGWPKGLFMLDRCFLVNRYDVSDGKELLVINTHNSAYDDGSLRKGQMEYLKKFLLHEYAKGNYIIVGGDWNQSPPGFTPPAHMALFDKENFTPVNKEYLPSGWTWFYDGDTPTNRRLHTPYHRSSSLVTIIDFYLLSPNVEGIFIKTTDLDFQNSDHQPVLARVRLKQN